MIRYIKQPNLSGCGPIALMNALKWANVEVHLSQFHVFKKACGANGDGCDDIGMSRGLSRQKYIKAKFIKNVTLAQINKALKSGKSVIFGYCRESKDGAEKGGWEGHYVFIARKTKKRHEIINHAPDRVFDRVSKETRAKFIKTKALVSENFVKNHIQRHWERGDEGSLDCWIISKN